MTAKTPVDILSTLQEQIPPHLARRDLAELAVLMRYAEEGAWAFALYNTVSVRDEVADALRELLAPLPVYSFTLTAQKPNPITHLKTIPPETGRAVAFFFDLEQTEGQTWKYLDMQRENLAALPVSLIFWITPKARGEGVRAAPNFWSQRSGIFDFTIESPRIIQEIRGSWAGQPVRIDTKEDWERQMRLYSGLLREYEAEVARPGALADLHGKLAFLLNFAARREEARVHLQQQLELGKAGNDKEQQVQALLNLGETDKIEKGRQAALTRYREALKLAGDSPNLRAKSLQKMGEALYLEGEADHSQTVLAEALTLYRQVGDRLGEANTLRAIGETKKNCREFSTVMELYQQALTLYQQIGDRLGEANALQSVGALNLELGNRDKGLKSLDQSLSLYRNIGDREGEAEVYWHTGSFFAQSQQPDKAISLITQAVQIFRQIASPNHPRLLEWEAKLSEIKKMRRMG